jgi:eukaryotic-like serine/threonine-protein kinase
VAETSQFRYRAFLSYSHRDTPWAKWLHSALEGFRVDKDMVGRPTLVGPVPKTLRPIFRDREDFSAGHSLNEQTESALQSSQFVVVICSQNAARSIYVNEEIRRFKEIGRGGSVIPIIVDGEPGDPERECFPPALRFKIGPDGKLTDEHEEPIAADARPQGDGKDTARLKLIAGLLGVGFDEIVRREDRARRQRMRNWIGALSILTLTFAGLAVYAEIERRHAVETLNAATVTSNNLIYDLAGRFRNQVGVPAALVKDILTRAQKLQEQLNASGQTSADLQHSQASALSEVALTLFAVGDRQGASEAVDKSRQILETLLKKSPNDPVLQLDLSVTYQRIADADVAAGQADDALAALDKARTLDEDIVAKDPKNEKAQDNVAIAYTKSGDILGMQGKIDDALADYQKSLAIEQSLVDQDKLNADWWRNLGASYESVGNALGTKGDLDGALKAFQERVQIAQQLIEQFPGNSELQRDLSVGENMLGSVYLAQQKGDLALSSFQQALAIRQKLAASDKDNLQWARDVAIAENQIGRVQLVAGKLDESLAAYQQAFGIEQKLVAQDKSNVEWLSDLCNSDLAIGLVQARQDKLDDAGKSFHDGLSIAEAQLKASPSNVRWQRDFQHGVRLLGVLANGYVDDGKFALALTTAEEAIGLSPNQIWINAERAHALMFLGRTDEARAIYLQYRGQKNVKDSTSWEQLVLSDFDEFRNDKLTNPLMDEIAKQFSGG